MNIQIEEQLLEDDEVRTKIPKHYHLHLNHLKHVVTQPGGMGPIGSTTPISKEEVQYRRNKIMEMNRLDSIDNQWFIFTFVRHPYNRLVSVWNFFQDQRKFKPIKMDQQRNNIPEPPPMIDPVRMTFSKKVAADFLHYRYGDLNGFLEDKEYFDMFVNCHDYLWFNSMSSFCDGNWDQYTKIYKCEDFNNEIDRYLEDIGLTDKVEVTIEHTNKSESLFKVEDLTQESKDTIYEFYKDDFEALGYER